MRINKHVIYFIIFIIISASIIILFNQTQIPEEEMNFDINYLINNISNPPTNKLFNLDFKYIINSNCSLNKPLLAVIIVTSYFGHVELRSAMRRSFTNEELDKYNIRRVFLLGLNPEDRFVKQEAVKNEAERFNDIIQGNFHEAYRNLTYKHLMGLKWAAENCNHSKYVIKMDDDIVINLPKIVSILAAITLPQNLLAGYILKGMQPIREKANKWYVTEEEYEEDYYPTFLSGWFYVTNPATSQKLVSVSRFEPYFWIDDTYITGVLARMLKIRHYSLNSYYTVHPEYLRCCMHDVISHKYDCEFLIGPSGGDNNLYFDFNNVLRKCDLNNCIRRTKFINETCVAERKFNLGNGVSVIKSVKL